MITFLIESLTDYLRGLGSKKIILFCCILIGLAYVNSLSVDFIWDDYSTIVSNVEIRELKLSRIFVPLYQEVSPDKFNIPIYYRPLQILSYAIDYSTWKLNPFGYHLTSLILQILNAILVFALLQELLKNNLYAFLGALLFGVNPIFTSSVTYISGRADLLLLLFSLAAVLCFIKSIKTGSLALAYYISSLFCFIFVLASKEIGAISVFFLFAIDKLIYKYSVKKNKNLIYVPYILIIFVWQLIKPVSLPGFRLHLSSLKDILFMFASIVKGIYNYAGLAFIPYHLRMGRSISVVYALTNIWFYIVSFLFLLTIVAIYKFRKNKLFQFGLIWFSLPLFMQLLFNYFFAKRGVQMLLPEHNLYFCYAGFLIIIFSCLGLVRIQKQAKQYVVFILVMIVLGYAGLTIVENQKWADEIRLFSTVIEYNKSSKFNYVAYANLGQAYERKKKFKEAESNFKLAAETSGGNPEFYNDFAIFYLRRNNLKKALEVLVFSRDLDRNFYQTYLLLGIIYQQEGLTSQARENYQKVLLMDPGNDVVARNLKLLKDGN
jgi:protein O-mannosyl-transferase